MTWASAPSRASSPLPRPLGFFVAIFDLLNSSDACARALLERFLAHALDKLLAKGQISLGAAGTLVVDDPWNTMAGRFGQAHVAGHHGLENAIAEVRFDLRGYLLLQGHPSIEHHAQKADEFEVGIDVAVDPFHRVHQIGQAFESEILA